MQKIKIIDGKKEKYQSFEWSRFSKIEAKKRSMKTIRAKTIKKIAQSAGIAYDEKHIQFAKIILEHFCTDGDR